MKTILVVEDEADILMGIKEFLQDEGFKVLTAQNGMEAMKKLKNNEIEAIFIYPKILEKSRRCKIWC